MTDRETRLVAALQDTIGIIGRLQEDGARLSNGEVVRVWEAQQELSPCPSCGQAAHDGGCPHSDQAEPWTADEILAREG